MILLLSIPFVWASWRTYINSSSQIINAADTKTMLASSIEIDDVYIEELDGGQFLVHSMSEEDKDEVEARIRSTKISILTFEVLESVEIQTGCSSFMMYEGKLNEQQDVTFLVTSERIHVQVRGTDRWNAIGLGWGMTNVDAWIFSNKHLTVEDSYLMGLNSSGENEVDQSLEQLTIVRENGTYTWEFWRDRDTGDSMDNVVDCKEMIAVSYAYGVWQCDAVGYHGANRGDLLITMEPILSIFQRPTLSPTWEARLDNVFTTSTVRIGLALPTCIAIMYILVWKFYEDILKHANIFLGGILCLWDAVTDYMLIIDWYIAENFWWASLMLLAIFIGGIYTAGHLRGFSVSNLRQAENGNWKKHIIALVIDISGLAVLRTMKDEYDDANDASDDGGRRKNMSKRLAKLWGSLLESVLSFALVSYYIIVGTASFHQDVSKPSTLLFASWFASIIGMMYKGYCATISKHDKGLDFAFFLINGFAATMLFILVALFPACVVAQNRNAVDVPLCPKANFSSIPLTYFLFWGIPILLILLYAILFGCLGRGKKDLDAHTHVYYVLLPLLGAHFVWISIIQIWIQFNGTFRTEIGQALCWPGSLTAILLLAYAFFTFVYKFALFVSYFKDQMVE